MVKPLRKIVPAQKGYTPKAGDEKKFAALHKGDVYADRAGNGDDHFKASNVKTFDRSANHYGRDAGDDEKAEFIANKEEVELDEAPLGEFWPVKSQDKPKNLYHHQHMFNHHTNEALNAHEKAKSSEDRARDEKDNGLKMHFTSLAAHYSKAAAHHLKVASHHARKSGIREEVGLDEAPLTLRDIVPLDEISVFKMQGYAKAANKKMYVNHEPNPKMSTDKFIKHQVHGTEKVGEVIKKKTGSYEPSFARKVIDKFSDKMKSRSLNKEELVIGEDFFEAGDLIVQIVTEGNQPPLFRIHSSQDGKEYQVWKCIDYAKGFELDDEVFDDEGSALVYAKNLMTQDHNARVNAEEEQLDELSPATLTSYKEKAISDKRKTTRKANNLYKARTAGMIGTYRKQAAKRGEGIKKADDRLKGVYKPKGHVAYHAEEAELNELSPTTLRSYRSKAAIDAGKKLKDANKAFAPYADRIRAGKKMASSKSDPIFRKVASLHKKAANRGQGISDASERLRIKGEEAELNELSPATLKSYTKKATSEFKARREKAVDDFTARKDPDTKNKKQWLKRWHGLNKAAASLRGKEETH
jgi:hypothetical protein